MIFRIFLKTFGFRFFLGWMGFSDDEDWEELNEMAWLEVRNFTPTFKSDNF